MTINFLNIIQVLVTISLIGFILFQRGPGATAGSAFGSSGASGTVFGAKGSSSFLTKSTAVLATLFFIITMAISINAKNTYGSDAQVTEQNLGVMGNLENADKPETMIPGDEEESKTRAVNGETQEVAPQIPAKSEKVQPEVSIEPQPQNDKDQAVDKDQGDNG